MNEYKKEIMKKEYAKQISFWKYEGKYEEYNMPSYEEMIELGYGITKESRADNYICYVLDNIVHAYVNMKEFENYIYIGIGLKPDLCGQGLGNYFLKDSIEEIKKRFNKDLFLEVRTWNLRAIKAYEKVGFKVTGNIIKKDRNGKDTSFTEMMLSI